ncbi:MAG: hypothetical protein GY761_14970 [Hyphomicrobiales bacterium]|nr:hypothetical protein [Hyphomicrobiales bacterium]
MRSTINMFLTLGFLISIPLLLSTVFASAQSFDCSQAHISSEYAICNNEVLLTLDEKLAEIYHNRRKSVDTTPQRQRISRDHTAWVKKRNGCDLDWTCLEASYNKRIEQLNREL